MMRLAGQSDAALDAKGRDSASQVSRAVIGLREMLLRGEFRPGERIAEIPLSSKLGVSRTPLRLAFEKLAYEGLIKALPHSGFTASEFSVKDIQDAIETRGILEGAAARIAAERLKTPAQLGRLRNLLKAMDDLVKSADDDPNHLYLDLNESFHAGILDVAGNKALQQAAERVNRLPFASPSALVLLMDLPFSRKIIPVAQRQHHAILNAIEKHEGARAEVLTREHSLKAQQVLKRALANKDFMNAIPGGYLIRFPEQAIV